MNFLSNEENHCSSTVWERKNIWPKWYTKKVLDTLSKFALKNSLYSVSTQIVFQPSRGFIQLNWGSREECHWPSKVWKRTSFCIRKKYSICCQILRSKTRYIVFQHKMFCNLVEDLIKWIEGPGGVSLSEYRLRANEFLT